jgi:hypothetical protein
MTSAQLGIIIMILVLVCSLDCMLVLVKCKQLTEVRECLA